MTPEQRVNYETEYSKAIERALDESAKQYIDMIRIFHHSEEAQINAMKSAMLSYQMKMREASKELDKLFQ